MGNNKLGEHNHNQPKRKLSLKTNEEWKLDTCTVKPLWKNPKKNATKYYIHVMPLKFIMYN